VALLNAIIFQLAGLTRLGKREDGQALAEYGLILALIAVVAVAALTALGLAVSGQLDEVTSAFG
jgi:pilus assembly protein Flp/PilA